VLNAKKGATKRNVEFDCSAAESRSAAAGPRGSSPTPPRRPDAISPLLPEPPGFNTITIEQTAVLVLWYAVQPLGGSPEAVAAEYGNVPTGG
jgi:hypothetical protein